MRMLIAVSHPNSSGAFTHRNGRLRPAVGNVNAAAAAEMVIARLTEELVV